MTIRIGKLEKGTYILLLNLKQSQSIQIGKLGKFNFLKGHYAYVGSAFAPGGLTARLNHHIKKSKNKPHWHIDYFRKKAEIVEIWICEHTKRLEHIYAGELHFLSGVTVPVQGFGCSDCKCKTHFFYISRKPKICEFQNMIQMKYPEGIEPYNAS